MRASGSDNKMRIAEAMEKNALRVIFNSNVISINDNFVIINIDGESQQLENDLVYIFAGGELPTKFLEKIGIQITKRFGHVMKKHR